MSCYLKRFGLLSIKKNPFLFIFTGLPSRRTLSTKTTPKLVEHPTISVDDIIKLTPACSARIDKICTDNIFLRIVVDNGGCSGFQYKFEMDSKLSESDIICGPQKRVVIDQISLEYCTGVTLDYHEDIMRAGFRITSNPKAETNCSCGVSFALKTN